MPKGDNAIYTLSEPVVTHIPNGVEYGYLEETHIPTVQFRDFHKDRNGTLTAEFAAFCLESNIMMPVAGIKFNLSSLQARKAIVKGIQEASLGNSTIPPDWTGLINDVCWRALKFYRNGLDLSEVWPTEEIIPPAYLVSPVLSLNLPTTIFGDPGSGKLHLALTLAITAQLPFTDNRLGLTAPSESINVLYLDYENPEIEFQRKLSELCRGFGVAVGIKRLPMTIPLPDTIEKVQKVVFDNRIGLIIVDSLALAAGGDLLTAETANRYDGALKQLGETTVLTLAHTNKDPLAKKKTIYGSVFFEAFSRSVWHCKKSQEADSNEMLVAMVETKYNRRKQLPFGLRFNFDDAAGIVNVSRCDLADTELSNELPLKFRIKNIMFNGALSVKEISEALDEGEASVRTVLNREKKMFIRTENGGWGLLSHSIT